MKTKILLLTSMGLMLLFLNASAKPAPKKAVARKVTKVYSMADLKKNLEFDFGKTSVRMTYNDRLDQLADNAVKNNYAISLRGYADSIGTYKANWVVSDYRAKAVKAYLVSKGVSSDKIIATPFGSNKPIASNKTKVGRQRNRRVEVQISEINN